MKMVIIITSFENMKPLRSFLFLVLAAMACSTHAQSKVTISSPDSLPFIAVWNNVQLNQVPSFSITFRENIVGKVPVQLSFPSHPNLVVKSQPPSNWILSKAPTN